MEKLDLYTLMSVSAALTAGKDIMEIYVLGDEEFGVRSKGDDSPLTAADEAAHRTIVSALASSPYPVLSEEGAGVPYEERSQWPVLWIVDPLDGTKEFIKRNGEFTVNIALVEKGRPVLGVVYAPVTGMLYWGSAGAGSYRVDVGECGGEVWERLRECVGIEELKSAGARLPCAGGKDSYMIVASKSHRNAATDEFIAEKEKLHDRVDVVSRGSSLKICLVAEGSADIYPRLGPTMEWDTAAGDAVAVFAGADVYDPATGQPLEYNKEDLLNPYFIVERTTGGE